MSNLTRALALLFLAATTVTAWSIRMRIADTDADPEALRRMKQAFGTLPREVGGGEFRGEEYSIDEDMVRSAGADTHASMLYTDSQGHRFQLYVGGNLGNRENFHAPNYCMPAHGWETLENRVVPFDAYATNRPDPSMRRLRLQYGQQHMIVYYWFQAGEALADHEWWVRIYRSLDLLLGRPLVPTVIVTVYVPVLDNEPDAEAAAQRFLRAIGPHLRFALTGEVPQ